MRTKLEFDCPEGVDPMDVITAIAEQADGDDGGTVYIDGETVDWDIRTADQGVPIDRRQRLAAAHLLMGFDLPQEMGRAARSMLEAAEICPDLNTGEIGSMGDQQHRTALMRARTLIDEMLAETAK